MSAREHIDRARQATEDVKGLHDRIHGPSAKEIRDWVRNPNPPQPVSYEGGMDLGSGDGLAVQSRGGVITLSPNIDFGGERGFAQMVIDLSPEESAELRLALEWAERAAKNFREATERRAS